MEVKVFDLDLLGLVFILLSPTLWNRWVGQNKFAFLYSLDRWGRLCLPYRYHTVSTLDRC